MKPGPGGYAGVVSRGIAFSIDLVIATVACAGGLLFIRAFVQALGGSRFADGSGGVIGFSIALPLVFMAYCAGLWALVGRTLGMMLLGLRVVAADGSPPGVARSIVRAVGYWVSAILFIGFAWIAVDARRQGFHDKLARTFVVYDWEPQPVPAQPAEITPARSDALVADRDD